MSEQLHYTCPICPLGHLLEYDADCDDYICQGCLLSAPGPVLERIAEGQKARGAVIALEAQLEAAKEALDPHELAAADGYVHVAIQAARACAYGKGREDERAEVVAWLHGLKRGGLAVRVETAEHVLASEVHDA